MQFAEAISLRQVGVPIPDDLIVEYSHLSRKADVANRIRQMQGLGEKSEQQMQLEQFQMESQIRSTQLEIAKLEAEVTKLQSETALNAAKVGQAEAEPQLKVAELQSKLQQKREELGLRERLSSMTNEMRQAQADVAAAAKLAAAAVKPTGGK
jgi:vacuolar-type H+-ATPase subunit I/STV1